MSRVQHYFTDLSLLAFQIVLLFGFVVNIFLIFFYLLKRYLSNFVAIKSASDGVTV